MQIVSVISEKQWDTENQILRSTIGSRFTATMIRLPQCSSWCRGIEHGSV